MLKLKKIQLIVLSAILMSAGFFASTANAGVPQNLTVTFTPNPLFGTDNHLVPGDSTTAKIEVKNLSGMAKPVAIEAINVDDPDDFGEVLNLQIKEGGTTILNKSLADFFAQGETFLSNLADGASTTYDLIVTFDAGAGNDYQNKVLRNFDILVGFQGEQTPPTPPGGGTNGGGGGGGIILPGLTIFNEADIGVTETTVTLTWQTNYNATSRVVYAPEAGGHDFNYLNQPNYGFDFSTVEDPTRVTFHTVNLTGLTPNTLYYYRVISHASPDTVGLNYTFKTLAAAGDENQTEELGTGGAPSEGTGGVIPGGTISGATGGAPAAGDATDQTGQVLGEEEQNGEVAGALEICRRWPYLLWIILGLVYLLMLLINYADKIKKNIREKYGSYLNWLFALLPLFISALAMIVCGVWAWWLWILMIIFYLVLIIFYFVHIDSPIYWRVSVVITLYLGVIAWLVRNCFC